MGGGEGGGGRFGAELFGFVPLDHQKAFWAFKSQGHEFPTAGSVLGLMDLLASVLGGLIREHFGPPTPLLLPQTLSVDNLVVVPFFTALPHQSQIRRQRHKKKKNVPGL